METTKDKSAASRNEVEDRKQEETQWIESEWLKRQNSQSNETRDEEEEEEPEISTDLFADPDPLETFCCEWETKEEKIQISLTGYKAELGQTLHSTGLTLWRASHILCDFMVRQEELVRASQNLLELGAGLGMCGILASKLGARRVTLTDGDTDALARMRDNVTLNNNNMANFSQCCQLVWGEHVDRFRDVHGTFDLILGSDIIYVEEIVVPLWDTIDHLLARNSTDDGDDDDNNNNRSNNKGAFWLAYARRNVSIELVLTQAEKRGFVWTIPDAAEGVYVFTRGSRCLSRV